MRGKGRSTARGGSGRVTLARIVATAGLAVMLAMPHAAAAQGVRAEGAYVAVAVGPALQADFETRLRGRTIDVGSDIGAAGTFAVGYLFPLGFRSEVEIGARANALDAPASVAAAVDGTLTQYSAMLNTYYDFRTEGPVWPYAGFGFGGVRIASSGGDLSTNGFAYQLIAGAAYAFGPQTEAFVDYRFMQALGIEHTSGPVTVRDSLMNHAVLFGMRHRFGTASRVAQRPSASPYADGDIDARDPAFRPRDVPAQPASRPAAAATPAATRAATPAASVVASPAPTPAASAASPAPPLDPTARVACRLADGVREVTAGWCHQMRGRVVPAG